MVFGGISAVFSILLCLYIEMKTAKSPKSLSRVIADAVISLNKKEVYCGCTIMTKWLKLEKQKKRNYFEKLGIVVERIFKINCKWIFPLIENIV